MSPKPVFAVGPAPSVEAFVAGEPQPLHVVEAASSPTQAPRKRASAMPSARLRRDDPGERLAVYLPPELVQALRIHCVHERRSASDAATEAIAT